MPPSRIGHYTIVAELGRGGMGVVYKAHEESLNRFVAIKVLSEQLASDPAFVARFVREAQAAAGLSHPNIIQIFYIGEEDAQHYFVMEYVSGKSLHAIVREESRIPNPRAAGYVAQAALGLAAAHDKGILHRDIKPANLMVNERGLVKIADFGLALPQDAATRLTMTGTLMGTPGYLSPEQCLGKPLDLRTDIYSLGVTYFELLTGTIPFQADSPLVLMRKILEDPPPDIAALNDAVDAETRRIVNRMIARNRDERYQTCHDLAADLDRYLGTHGVRISTPGAVPLPASGAIEDGATTRMPKSEPLASPPAAPAAPPAGTPPTPPAPAEAVAEAAPTPPTAAPSAPPAASPGAIADQAAASVPPGQAPQQGAAPSAPPPASRSRAPLMALAAVLLLLIGGAVAAFLALRSPAAKGFLAGLLGHAKTQEQATATAAATNHDGAAAVAPNSAPASPGATSSLDAASAGSPGQPRSSPGAAVPPEAGSAAGAATSAEAAPGQAGTATGPGGAGAAAEIRDGAGRPGGVPRTASRHRVSRSSEGRGATQDAASREVTVAVIGAQPLAGALGGPLVAELQGAGLEPLDAQSVPALADALGGGAQPGVSAMLAAAREAGLRRLVLVRVDPVGERQLNYMDRSDIAYSARVTATCYDVRSGRPLGAAATTTVEHTALSLDRAAEKAAGTLAPPILELLR